MGSQEVPGGELGPRAGPSTVTLSRKMSLAAGLAALLCLVALAAAYAALVDLELIERAGRAVVDAQIAEQRLVRVLNEALLSGGATNSRTQAQEQIPALDAMLRQLAANVDVPELKETVEGRILPLWGGIRPLDESLIARRTLAPEDADDQIALGKIIGGSDKLSAELALAVDRTDRHLSERRLRVNVAIVVLGILALGFALLLVLYVYRAVRASLGGTPEGMAEATAAFARGDLVAAVHVREGDASSAMAALEHMRLGLADAVRTIRAGADTVGKASREIAQGNSDLSTRTEEQASALEEAAASMEEMAATVSQSAENARKASELATGASAVAARGGQAVGAVVSTMAGITDFSRKIADIVGVIDSIAFQTNILALNAAVEAARAGEQGRGFAVVASEVRSLAQRSATAAKEIREMISDSVGRIATGSQQVEAAGETMGELVASVKRVTDLIAEISAASQEQSQNLSQVNHTVARLEQVTQQNAAMVEEAAAASASLENQAEALLSAVAAFRLEDSTPHGAAVEPDVPSGHPALSASPPALAHLR